MPSKMIVFDEFLKKITHLRTRLKICPNEQYEAYFHHRDILFDLMQIYCETLADFSQDIAVDAGIDLPTPIKDYHNAMSDLLNDYLYEADEYANHCLSLNLLKQCNN